jgi:hypothetical protein
MPESNDRQIVINHRQEGDPGESILDNQGYHKCFHDLQSNSSMLRIVTYKICGSSDPHNGKTRKMKFLAQTDLHLDFLAGKRLQIELEEFILCCPTR